MGWFIVGVGMGHEGGERGSCRGGVGWVTAKENMNTKCTFIMTIKNFKNFTLQPQDKGPGTSRGQIYVLPMTWRWRHWGPLSVDMQPYGCFIFILLPIACLR